MIQRCLLLRFHLRRKIGYIHFFYFTLLFLLDEPYLNFLLAISWRVLCRNTDRKFKLKISFGHVSEKVYEYFLRNIFPFLFAQCGFSAYHVWYEEYGDVYHAWSSVSRYCMTNSETTNFFCLLGTNHEDQLSFMAKMLSIMYVFVGISSF